MSDEQDKLKLSLEPPKLFGRKKKPAPADASEAEPTTPAPKKKAAAEPTAKVEEEPVVEPVAEPVVEPVAEPVVEPVVEPAPEPVEAADEPAEVIVLEEDVAEEDVVEETAPAETSVPEEHAAWAPSTETDATSTTVIEPATAPEPDLTADPDPEPTAPLPSADLTTKTRTPKIPKLVKASKKQVSAAPAAEPEPVDTELADTELVDTDAEDAEIAAMAAQGPLLSAYRSAVLTGLVVGAAMVVLTWLSLRGCEAVRGTSSCGGGPGFLLLIATFAVCVLLGSALLRAFDIPDPGSSSFLAVGLVAVVALLFLINLLDHWSMLIIIPVLSIGAYLASVWVTKTFVEPVDT